MTENDEQSRKILSPGDQARVDEMVKQLTEVLGPGLGTRSRWALRTAADAAKTEGIAGILVIQIPANLRDHVDVQFTVGLVEVVARWTGS